MRNKGFTERCRSLRQDYCIIGAERTKHIGRTGLHQAAVQGDVEEVELLLSGGANPNTQDAHMQTPITLAAERGLEEVVRALAEHGDTDINLQDSFGRTPLHWCAKRCDVKGVEALLGTGRANVHARTTGGDSALHWVCSANGGHTCGFGNFEERSLRVTELLLAAGADVRAKNCRGETPRDVLLSTSGISDAIMALLMSTSDELDKREEEEAVKAERNRSLTTQRPGAAISDGGSSAKPSPMGSGWPAKQSGAMTGLSKRSGTSGAVSTKKVVIKLKKKP